MQKKIPFLVLTLAIGVFLTACDPDDQTSSPQSKPSRFVEQPVKNPPLSLQHGEKDLKEAKKQVVEWQKKFEEQRKRAEDAEKQVGKFQKELEEQRKRAEDAEKQVGKFQKELEKQRKKAKDAEEQVNKLQKELEKDWWLKVAFSTIGAFVAVFLGWMFWPRKVVSPIVSANPAVRPRCPRCGWEHDPADTICKNPACKTQF